MRHPEVELELVRDPHNPVDPDAIAVFCPFGQIGYLPADWAAVWSPEIDSGRMRYTCGYRSVGSFTADDGREIVTAQIDVDQWELDPKPRRSQTQPPEHRQILATAPTGQFRARQTRSRQSSGNKVIPFGITIVLFVAALLFKDAILKLFR